MDSEEHCPKSIPGTKTPQIVENSSAGKLILSLPGTQDPSISGAFSPGPPPKTSPQIGGNV